jgi:hypothetical protein
MIQENARNCRGEYKDVSEKAIIGTTVLTTYNNKKYRGTFLKN